jgi:hypothetical protein
VVLDCCFSDRDLVGDLLTRATIEPEEKLPAEAATNGPKLTVERADLEKKRSAWSMPSDNTDTRRFGRQSFPRWSIKHMAGAGHARIERMHCLQRFQRLLTLCDWISE